MKKNKLYGAILGDLAGQPYEFPAMQHFPPVETINLHNPDSVITDDTLMTLATAKSILDNQPIEEAYKEMGLKYPGDHYGKGFKEWLQTPLGTVGQSWGNGCLMRMSPYMYLNADAMEKFEARGEDEDYEDIDERKLIVEACMVSHSNPVSVLACLKLMDLYNAFGFFQFTEQKHVDELKVTLDIQPFTKFAVRADDTIEFCSNVAACHKSTHEAIKFSISRGGDTDTNASIIGELMNFTYGDLTDEDIAYVESKLDPYLLDILHRFNQI